MESFSEKCLMDTLEWIHTIGPRPAGEPNPRLQFIKMTLNLLTWRELEAVKSMSNNRAHRQRIKLHEYRKQKNVPELPNDDIPMSDAEINAEPVAQAAAVVSPAQPIATTKGWWERMYKKNDVFAIDCEFVLGHRQPLALSAKMHTPLLLASVTIVNFDGEIVFHKKAYRPFGSYNVTPYTVAINGFRRRTLDRPNDPNFWLCRKIFNKVSEILTNKLIVGARVIPDLTICEFQINNHRYDQTKVYDITNFFWYVGQPSGGEFKDYPHNLRTLALNYFGVDDFQAIGAPHDPTEDARMHMSLFKQMIAIKKSSPEIYNISNREETRGEKTMFTNNGWVQRCNGFAALDFATKIVRKSVKVMTPLGERQRLQESYKVREVRPASTAQALEYWQTRRSKFGSYVDIDDEDGYHFFIDMLNY